MIYWVLTFILIRPFLAFTPESGTADLIVINAKVRTMDRTRPTAEAIAVKGSEIIAVGSNAEVRAHQRAATRVIDAQGKLVLPGFNDSHVHFMAIGNTFSSVDLRDARSSGDVVRKLKHYARFLPKGRWILGGGWDHVNWSPADPPTRTLIDAVTPDHPVFIYRADTKTALANGHALKLAQITKESADALGGEILRDAASGEPNGILRGKAISLVRSIIPANHTRDWPAVAEAASKYAASLGVTSVQDTDSDDHAEVYRQLERQGKLHTKIYDCISLSRPQDLESKPRSQGREMVRQGCLKGFSDGEPGDRQRLKKDIHQAEKSQLQVMIHAIGPRANDDALSAIELAARTGRRDRRFRVEHAYNAAPPDIARFTRAGAIASVQPYLFYGGSGGSYRKLLDSGARLALGSDASITDFDPLLGIHAAVTAGHGQGISVEEAVYAYTLGSAYAEFQEDVKGSIESGKLADFIMLSEDIFAIPAADTPKAKVLMTVVNGRIVYENK